MDTREAAVFEAGSKDGAEMERDAIVKYLRGRAKVIMSWGEHSARSDAAIIFELAEKIDECAHQDHRDDVQRPDA